MVTNKNKCVGGLIRIHVSSIVNEVIKTVSSQFFFLRKYFERTKAYKRKITNFASLRRFYVRKIVFCSLVCVFVGWVIFGLIYVFVCSKSFCKKTNWLKIVLITSSTILL